jgi:3-hydroxybutyryl-CoA dehydrogenase
MTTQRAHICVVGAGTMGRGIAQVAVAAGHRVSLVDTDSDQQRAATAEIARRLSRNEPDAAAMVEARLSVCTDITDVPTASDTIVIEAITENLGAKQSVFRQSLDHFGPDCILATNTSSLSVTEIAAGVQDPSRVVGMHFFNPVPAMRLVEVVNGLQTDPAAAEAIAELGTSWGKQVARVRSTPGFIVNRVARPFYGEALRLLEEGAAGPACIDELFRSAGQFRMGPFELMDLIGTEVNYTVSRTVWRAFNYDPRFAPSQLQGEIVAAGRFGRKTGRGFYDYAENTQRPIPDPARSTAECPEAVTLHGSSAQLETLLTRAAVSVTEGEPGTVPHLEIPGIGSVVVTRGKTSREESSLLDQPALVLDRCMEPAETSALALASDDESLTASMVAVLVRAGVRPYVVADTPGLVIARVLSMIANEAWEAAQQNVASPDDIDTAMILGTNYPCGPFEWSGRWSLTSVLEVIDGLWQDYRDPRYRASLRLRMSARAEGHSHRLRAGIT